MSWATRLNFRNIVNISRNIHSSLPRLKYESSVSLKSLYPNSDPDITKKVEPPKSQDLRFSGYIPMEELQITYSKSSGPGGQNVNKINSKVDMRFHLQNAEWLTQPLKEKIYVKFKTSINAEGYLIVRSDKTRSQQLNLADALDKLRSMIHSAVYMPPPPPIEAVERSRRRHEAAVRERLRQKKIRSTIKQDRQGPEVEL